MKPVSFSALTPGHFMAMSLTVVATFTLMSCGVESMQRIQSSEIPTVASADGDSTPDYATESSRPSTIEPCTPYPGSDRDPCARRVPWILPSLKYPLVAKISEEPDPVPNVRQRVDKAFDRITQLPHQVVRGVVIPGSTRCTSQNGLGLTRSDDVLWWPGGSHIRCFVDVAVREYLVGEGPARITLQKGMRSDDEQSDDFGTVPRNAEYFAEIASPLIDSFEGYEWVFWLEVPLDPTIGAWGSSLYWSIQRKDDGDIVAVDRWSGRHTKQDSYSDVLETELNLHVTQVKRARQHYDELYGGRVSASAESPSIIATSDRSSLVAYLSAIGAFEVPGFASSLPPPAPIPPIEPGDVAASQPNDDGGILISWSASPSGDAIGYKVVRRVPKGEFATVVADTGSTDTTYTDTSAPMTAGTTYIYRVLALNEYGESVASNRATVVLPGPDAPADLTATYSDGDVVLTWTQPGVIQPSCYRIYRRAQREQTFTKVENCWRYDLRTWTDEDVATGTRYIYRLVPIINTIESGVMESGNTSRASIRVP